MSDELIGQTIGGYEVLSRIGEGGMATVYLARQTSMNRQVALKVLPRHFLSDDTYLQRFEQEVQIVAQLEHRNIIPVYDYGEHEGQPYIAMRYMPAGSVDDRVKAGPMPLEQVLSIVAQIAPALDYAHSRKVLHRDLKPSNVLMDDDGGAFITDFGIARLLGEPSPGITTHGVVGTPSYMSPEQAQARPMDGRSDIYALGVMIFEMLTSRRPFTGDTPYSIAVKHVMEAPPAPSSFNAHLNPAVERVVLYALSKAPEDRPATAVALAEALQQAVDNPISVEDTLPHPRIPEATVPTPIYPSDPAPVAVQAASVAAPVPNLTPHPSTPHPHPSNADQTPASPSLSPVHPPSQERGRRWHPMLSALMGGTIGCGLLLLLLALGFLLLTRLLIAPAPGSSDNDALTLSPANNIVIDTTPLATPSPTPLRRSSALPDANGNGFPTLEPTSAAYRETLVARSAANDATRTAIARQTEAAPTRAVDPVGVRGRPDFPDDLSGVSGEIVYHDRRENGNYQIVKLDLATWETTTLTNADADSTYPVVSPDGRWIAFQSDRDGDFDIYVMNTFGGQLTRVTDNALWDRLPGWSPDSDWLIFSSDVRGDENFDLYRVRPDGSDLQQVYSDGRRNSHARYSPDGEHIVFTSGDDQTDARTWEIVQLNVRTNQQRTLTENSVRDGSPLYSNDGEHILYITFTGESNAVMLMNADGTRARQIYDSPANEWAASFSPGDDFILITQADGVQSQLMLMRLNGETVQQITFDGGAYASWVPPIAD